MAGRKEPEERPDWEISNIATTMFTSLFIILLAFFIMLSSLSVVDEQRKMEALGSVLGAFGILPGGLSTSEEPTGHVAPQTSPVEVIQADLEHIREILANRAIEGQVRFLSGRTRRIISLDDAVLFPPDGVEILPEMMPVLTDIYNILAESDYPVVIEGHTDDQPPQNEKLRDNWHVSSYRALNILRFFLDQGADPARFSAYGYAGNNPIVANTSPNNRARNRRIDIVLDQTQRLKVKKLEEQYRRPSFFDFRGFSFRLFGGEKKQ